MEKKRISFKGEEKGFSLAVIITREKKSVVAAASDRSIVYTCACFFGIDYNTREEKVLLLLHPIVL
jgi:hypothetical protein